MAQRRNRGGYLPVYPQHSSMGKYAQDPPQRHQVQSQSFQHHRTNMHLSNPQTQASGQRANGLENLGDIGAWSDDQVGTQQSWPQGQSFPPMPCYPPYLPVIEEQTLDPRILWPNQTTGFGTYQTGQPANANRNLGFEASYAPLYFSDSRQNHPNPIHHGYNHQLGSTIPFNAAPMPPQQFRAGWPVNQREASGINHSTQGYPNATLSNTGRGYSTVPSSINLPLGSESQEPDRSSSTTETSLMSEECSDCGKSYTGRYRKGNLARHRKSKHEGRDDIPCGIPGCDKTFQRSDARVKHIRTAHQPA